MDRDIKISWGIYDITLTKEMGSAMKWLEISKDCPCRKGESCVNGLKCSEKTCFLLKGRKAGKGDIY
jgi:hypothetical protein